MNHTTLRGLAAVGLLAAALLVPHTLRAHCDALDGPVVQAARKALDQGDVTPALVWVRAEDEPTLKQAFQRALAVRRLNAEARELADTYFFETLVRVHRAGENAPYTGLKPAGRDLGPAIPAADKALDNGEIDSLVKLLTKHSEHGLRERFEAAHSKRKFAPKDVAAGREFVKAYVEYIHYVEGLHAAAQRKEHGQPSEQADLAAHQKHQGH